MRKLTFLACIFAVPAMAGEPAKPTVEDVTAQANSLISAVRAQRDACQDQSAQLGVQIEKLTKELAAAKESKPIEAPKVKP